MPEKLRLVDARPSDIDAILEIEALSFPSPWARQVFLDELGRAIARLRVLRVHPDGPVAAFINYWVVQDEIHVLNVATHPDWRRRGLGRRMMRAVVRAGQLHHARLITLEVRQGNRPAIDLYLGLDFVPVGVRPRYYENNEDAIVMVLKLRDGGA